MLSALRCSLAARLPSLDLIVHSVSTVLVETMTVIREVRFVSSILNFIHNGGVMMYPLILVSILLVTMAIERFVTLHKAYGDGDELLHQVKELFPSQPDLALATCENSKTALGRVFARGLRNAKRDAQAIELAMELEAANEQPQLDANMPIIKTIVNIAPLLGLLGTIAGMISSFRAASQSGLSNPTAVLGGISEALISTATGIGLAVLGFLFFNYFSNLAKKVSEDMDYYSAELVNFLTGRID